MGGVSSRCGIEQIRKGGIGSSTHSQSEQYLIGERFIPPTNTHYGTPFLRPSAYKARVGGVFLRCGIEQIREGGIGSLVHFQSEQYLIGERFVPPTIIIIIIIFLKETMDHRLIDRSILLDSLWNN